ncbi:MAG: TIGR02996 domain-containing protein [Planctomycetes bacterium]|nr:TIGR02996 domain-containing protein [Planctomycetota bacterium]
MSDETAFLDALKANLADDTTRLVYADWLDEHNEPAKAEYLRLVTRLPLVDDGIDLSSPEATRANNLGGALPTEWQETAAGRFDVVMLGYVDKVRAIMRVRVMFEVSLESAIGIVECAPNRIVVHTAFSSAITHLGRLAANTGMVLAVRPCDYDGPLSAVMFQVLVTCTPYEGDHDPTEWRVDPERDERATSAFYRLVGRALGIDQSAAHVRVTTTSFIPEDRHSMKCLVVADGLSLLQAQQVVKRCNPFVDVNRSFGVDCHISGRNGPNL